MFGYLIRSLDESLSTLFCISFRLIHNIIFVGRQTLHQIRFTIILPFVRDNVLCLITSFFPQVKKVQSSTIFPLGCFVAMKGKLNCKLLGFQFQPHKVQIRILTE